MKWIGQQIYDQVSRFRHDFYLEGIAASTETDMLVVDSAGKVSKRAIDAITVDVSDFMTNGVNNRVLTATGADAINAEANLTFDGSTLSVQADSNTTASALSIDANSLTTGNAIFVDVDDALTDTASSNSLVKVDYDKSGITDDGVTNTTTGLELTFHDAATNHANSTVIYHGVRVVADSASNQGTIHQTGFSAILTDADVANTIGFSSLVEDGGIDFKAASTADTSDIFTIATGAAGATTLTTVDADAALAHFEIAADGDITLDAAGDIVLEAGGNDVTVDTDNFTIESATTGKPVFTLLGTGDGNKPVGQFYKHISASPATGDGIAEITFQANNDADQLITYARIFASNEDATDGAEEGNYEIYIKNTAHATSPRSSFNLTGNGAATDATIGFGATSVTTVAGDLQVVGGNIIGTTDGDIQIDSDNDIILNVDRDNDGSNTMVKFTDNGVDRFLFNVSKGAAEVVTSTPLIQLTSTKDGNKGGGFTFKKERTDSTIQIGEAGDEIGTIDWKGYNDGTPALKSFAAILGGIADPVTGAEAGNLTLFVASYDGVLTNGLQLLGDTNADGEVDVTIAAGAASTTTVAGTLTMGSTATLNNTGILQTAAQTNITSLGTLTALTVDNIGINGNTITASSDLTLDVAGDIDIDAGGEEITVNSDVFTFLSGVSNKPIVRIRKTGDDTTAPEFRFQKDKGAAGDDGDDIGVINFVSDDTAQTQTTFARILAEVSESQNVSAAGKLTLSVAESAAGTEGVTVGLSPGLILEGEEGTNNEVDVTIANGSASTTTVAGNLKVTTGIELSHDSDTTIARASAGVVTIEGVNIAMQSLRIKLIPTSFMADDSGRPLLMDDTGQASENFFVESNASATVYASVDIPTGYKATHIMVFGSATDAIECWEMQINSKTGVSKGTGNVDTEINITDVTSSTTNYLLIQVANASGNEIHGGYVTIAVA